MPIKIIALLLLIFFAGIVITQILWPSLVGRPLFPFFRKETKLKDEIRNAQQELHEKSLSKTLNHLNRKVQK